MRIRKLGRNILKFSGLTLMGIGGFVILDIAVARSVYRPLTYAYRGLSWLTCQRSPASLCEPDNLTDSTSVTGQKGMVVTTQAQASKVGLEILQAGGNAIDAAVAIGYALAVSDPCCGNIGGGGFMLIRLANGKEIFLDFREKAPLAATWDMYLDREGKIVPKLSTQGYLAVGVPGTVKGLDLALTRYGTLSRQQVMQPAIELAQQGFILQAGDVSILKAGQKKFQDANVAAIFLKNGKEPYRVGDRLIQRDLAKTLESIAAEGTEAFYRGAIARKIVDASQANSGILSLEDFENYEAIEREPLRCDYRGYQVISSPPPGGGTTLCQMLNILSGYPLKQWGWRSTESLHAFLSAMLYAYRDRNNYLGDPDFIKIPANKLLSSEYAEQIRRQIPPNRAIDPKPLFEDVVEPEGSNTTHYSVIDKDGNAVAVTYTINSYFGAGVIASDTGFLLNNEMDDFTSRVGTPNQFGLVQGKANAIEPGKRPLSSMAPTIVLKNGKIALITGSPGGSTIPTTILQVITNIIDYDMSVDLAVNSPKIHYQGMPNVVLSEPYGLDDRLVRQLWEKGYRVMPFSPWGAAESIQVDPKTQTFDGVNDRRKPAGKAIGF